MDIASALDQETSWIQHLLLVRRRVMDTVSALGQETSDGYSICSFPFFIPDVHSLLKHCDFDFLCFLGR